MSAQAPLVILFDLDDTLFQHSESVAAGVLAHRRSHHGPLADADDDLEFARWQQLEELHYDRYLSGELGFLDQRRARARDFVAPFDLDLRTDAAADAWFAAYIAEYRRTWRLHDDALASLDTLTAAIPGVRFGVITNSVMAVQIDKLESIGLAPRLEHVIASGDFGVAKPDARIFHHACEAFGVEPAGAVYVGDRVGTDAIGAAAAGLLGVWICRGRTPLEAEIARASEAGVLIVASLQELPLLLADDQRAGNSSA